VAKVPGLVKGLGVTLGTLFETVTKGANTVQYPHEKEAPPTRARGVIALHEGNCTSCMLCARSCPDWCIYIEGHKELAPPRREGGKPRQVNKLDRFDIDYALCMYCGICVEVCPFDALFWSPNTNTPSRALPTCCTTCRSWASGWRLCPKPPNSKLARTKRRSSRCLPPNCSSPKTSVLPSSLC